jgi:DNA-binding HxlR family transcriptional regulator
MVKDSKINWDGCPVRYAASIFADRWSFMLLRDVLFKGRRYYGEFLDAGEGISTNILADRLGKLEASGIFTRHRDQIKKSKVYYLPTEKALELIPIFLSIIEWAERHDENTEVPRDFITSYRNDADATILESKKLISLVNEQITKLN